MYQISLAAAIFVFGSLFSTGAVLAIPPENPNEGDLIVNFRPNPLFSDSNLLPGDAKIGEAEVINNTGETKRIATEAINYPKNILGNVPDDDLSRALMIVIREKNGSDLYGGSSPTGIKTLFNFYTNGETYLSDVSGGGTKTYQFEISFPIDKEDEWQGATTGFDIIVGFQGTEGGAEYCNNNGAQDNGETGIDCGGGGCPACGNSGGGGSGGGLPPGLIIKYESAVTVGGNYAEIEWWTSYNATSQVVYAKSDEAHTLNLNDNAGTPPKYGYARATEEFHTPANPNGVTYRKIRIDGLASGTTYYFRSISHASPPTVSREHSFTTLAMNDNNGSSGGGSNNNGGSNNDSEVKETSTHPTPYENAVETNSKTSSVTFPAAKTEGDNFGSDTVGAINNGSVLGASSNPVLGGENKEKNNTSAETENSQNEYSDVTQKSFLDYNFAWLALILILIIIGLALYIIKLKKNQKKNV